MIDIEELVKDANFNKMASDPEWDRIFKDVNTPINKWVKIEDDDFIITCSGSVLLKNADDTKYLVAKYIFTPPRIPYYGEDWDGWAMDFYNIKSGKQYNYDWITKNFSHMCLIKTN